MKKIKPNALILFLFMVKFTFLNNELLQPRSESQKVFLILIILDRFQLKKTQYWRL
jgi:hypothetical protein